MGVENHYHDLFQYLVKLVTVKRPYLLVEYFWWLTEKKAKSPANCLFR
jgi:hypothetical protein